MSTVQELLADLASGEETRSEAAARMLANLGESILPALEGLLASPDPDQRWWAIRTLAEMRQPPLEILLHALRDNSPEVRAAAALALAGHADVSAVPELIRILGDADNTVATLGGRALVAIGNPAVPQLLAAIDVSTDRGRIQIMRSLAEIRDPRAIGAMLKATESDSAVMSYWASAGLETLGLNMVYLKPE